MGHPNSLTMLTASTLFAFPFFILEGPDCERLCCQWTNEVLPGNDSEFEVISPDEPNRMGRIFGVYDHVEDAFRMLPARDRDGQPGPALYVDLNWRGDLNSVMDCGADWEWEDDQMVIAPQLVA